MRRTVPQLLADAKGGNSRAIDELVRLHEPLVRNVANAYFVVGAERDDVLQEARLGLIKAIRDYDPSATTGGFNGFARLCVTRQVITALKTALRLKHSLLNTALTVGWNDAGEQVSILDLLPSPYNLDPFVVVCALEELRAVVARSKTLTPLERRAVMGVAAGISYCELEGIPEGTKPKTIDNAVQRGRWKLRGAPGGRPLAEAA